MVSDKMAGADYGREMTDTVRRCHQVWVAVAVPNVNVNNLLAISESDFDNSGEPGPQAEGVNHLEAPLRQLHVTHRASSCA